MSNLRNLIDRLAYIDHGGELIRELDLRTGRITSKTLNEAVSTGAKQWPSSDSQIRAFQRANPPLVVDGMIGKKTIAVLQQQGYVAPQGFKPVADKATVPAGDSGSNAANGNISDFPSSSQDKGSAAKPNFTSQDKGSAAKPNFTSQGDSQDGDSSLEKSAPWRTGKTIAGQNADGSFNADHPFVLAMDRKVARNRNPNGNNGHDGSGIDPNDDPADPKTWPSGVKAAPDFGYLDPEGMWIPTPFHVRDDEGRWDPPRKSPANLIGIGGKGLTPFQDKVQKMEGKFVNTSASAIEQQKSVKLPNGAPTIPGFQQVDANQFSTDAREPGMNKTIDWVYTYRRGKDFILIAPMFFYNTKISTGRHYPTWTGRGIKTDDDRVPSKNGTVFVANQSFNVDDKILSVVVNTSIGAGNIGPQILKSISASGRLTPA